MNKVKRASVLFTDPTGPLVQYGNGMVFVENLNPQVSTAWGMTRREMLAFGWRCIVAAFRP